MTADQDPRVGTVLQDRYRIHSRIAAGGMGVVYRAERVQLERTVAVKFLHPWIVGEKDIVRRFEIEARAMSRLFHPHCVAVTDFGVDDGAPYLVMDFVTGATLKSILEKGRLRGPRAVGIVRQVLAGLAHAHGNGIIHRDVKPANILLTDATGTGDHIKILDFGLAKLRDSTSDLTTGLAVGTPCYMSPEQTLSDRIDERTDVYATGVLLVELLTGRRPFEAEQAFDILAMHREAPRPRLRKLAPDLSFSEELEEVVAKALAKRREDRFASATEFSAALGATPEGSTVSSLRDVATVAAVPEKRELPATVATVAAVPTPRRATRKLWALPLLLVPAAVASWLFVRDGGESGAGESRSPSGEVLVASSVASSVAPGEAPEGDEAPAGEPAELEDRQISDDRPEIRRVQSLMRSRRWDQALRELGALRTRNPDDALIPFLTGNVYFDRTWWSQGLAAYRETIAKDPAYRQNQYLIRDVIHSLTSDRFHGKAETFLLREIGPAAIPYLEAAAARHDTVGMSQRAAGVLKRLRAQR